MTNQHTDQKRMYLNKCPLRQYIKKGLIEKLTFRHWIQEINTHERNDGSDYSNIAYQRACHCYVIYEEGIFRAEGNFHFPEKSRGKADIPLGLESCAISIDANNKLLRNTIEGYFKSKNLLIKEK